LVIYGAGMLHSYSSALSGIAGFTQHMHQHAMHEQTLARTWCTPVVARLEDTFPCASYMLAGPEQPNPMVDVSALASLRCPFLECYRMSPIQTDVVEQWLQRADHWSASAPEQRGGAARQGVRDAYHPAARVCHARVPAGHEPAAGASLPMRSPSTWSAQKRGVERVCIALSSRSV